MRYFDEFNWTTNNYVYNRVRIPYHSTCGWCGLGSRCNKRYKQKWYHGEDNSKRRKDNRFPNWKLVSKNKKQWQDKPIWKKYYKRRPAFDGFEYVWNGNNLR